MNYLNNDNLREYVIGLRRYFHQNPEISGHEINTTNRIKNELKKLEIPYHEINSTTVVAWLGDGKKKIALRGDTDALPLEEQGDKEYISKNCGAMHACGHDGHTAMLLGAAKYLKEHEKILNGKIYFCFQPAEEIGGGALEILNFLEGQGGVDEVFGIHLWSLIPVNKICVSPGPRMANGDGFSIKVIGKGGHSSRPDQCVDPLKIAAKILLEITSLPTNRISALDPSVISVGKLYGGTASNIIPSEAFLHGGIRTFSQETRETIPLLINKISYNIAEYHGGQVEVTINKGVPCVFNHSISSERAKNVVSKLLGPQGVFEFEPICASENFGFYTEKYQGLMAFVGAGNIEKGIIYPHHHPLFDIDEDSLINGTALYSQYALDFLSD